MSRVTKSVLGVTRKLIKSDGKLQTQLLPNNGMMNSMCRQLGTSGLKGTRFISCRATLKLWLNKKTTRKTFKSTFEENTPAQNILNFDKKTQYSDDLLKYLRIVAVFLTIVGALTAYEWAISEHIKIFYGMLKKLEYIKKLHDEKTSAEDKKT